MDLRETIVALCRERLGREPELERPTGFNDLIQWLKLYDQRPEHVTACDKLAVRAMVRAQEDCLVPAWPGMVPKRMPCIVKATHDCGSARIIRSPRDIGPARRDLKDSLSRPYGAEKGEWAYRFIRPRLLTERLLERDITDYKFHCSHGIIRWVQVIRGRWSGETRETILAPDGALMDLHMDQNMTHDRDPAAWPGDAAWGALTRLAATLAQGWRYVRVDLYWSARRAWFGELTFWPLAGCYLTDDEPRFGAMLDLDLTEKREPIVR